MHSNILLISKRVCQLDIFVVVIGSVSYVIPIRQDRLGVFKNIYTIIIGTPLVC
jgi:hypothetical protein